MALDPWKYFRLAADVAKLKDDRRTHKLGAIGLRSDGALVCAANGPVRPETRNGSTKAAIPSAHAEARVCRKLDYYATVFVVRMQPSGYGLARPCPHCERRLRKRRVKRVYYTISPSEYGVMEL